MNNMNSAVPDNGAIRKNGATWVLFAIISHTAWGAYPVLSRYLQNTHHIATMSLSAMTNILAVILLLVFLARSVDIKTLGIGELIVFGLIVVSRGLLNLYASRLTYATNVQLFSLLAPFIVAFLSKTFLKEALPKHTGLALLLSLVGSVLLIFGAPGAVPLTKAQGLSNWIGIGLSIIGGILLAFLMLAIKHVSKKGASAETLAFVQFASLAGCMSAGSVVVGENWKPWLSLPPSGIAAYLAFALIVLLMGTILQNNSVKHLGAATYSTIQAWRLTSTIAFSWLLLGEGIATFWQGLGAFIVMATVTGYMYSQKRDRAAQKAAELSAIGE
jgi:drug/metabolite transporter (DMT)-like permease